MINIASISMREAKEMDLIFQHLLHKAGNGEIISGKLL